jgi:predicted SAM-dependent methyltransferase
MEKLIKLDLGCGASKQEGFTGMDIRKLPGVDIVHNIEEFPWPIKRNACTIIIASHLVEHIEPRYSIQFMDECWRIMTPGGTLCIATPYPGSRGYWQDPTHKQGWSEVTFQYFDPKFPLYQIYQPKPWMIHAGFPTWQVVGNLEVIMEKVLVVKGEEK